MGLNEFKSLESNVSFFSNGNGIAFLWLAGRDRWSNDALRMQAITGEITQVTCFTSQVGIRLRRQCFEGTFLRRAAISSAIVGMKVDIGSRTARSVMTGDRTLAADVAKFFRRITCRYPLSQRSVL
jgi:hypothetical protein